MVLGGGDQVGVVAGGEGEEPGGVGGGVGVVVRVRDLREDVGAELGDGGKKFFGAADAGEGHDRLADEVLRAVRGEAGAQDGQGWWEGRDGGGGILADEDGGPATAGRFRHGFA